MNNLISSTEAEEAKKFIKSQRALLIEKFARIDLYPSAENPFSIFMAGSPGAGKTEFSKALIKIFIEDDNILRIVRIDADEIRDMIPQYNGHNSDVVQGAASLGVEKIYDHVLKNKQNVILDGTFADYKKSRSNIERSLGKNRKVGVFYIYQDPVISWELTKKREKLEGRYVPKQIFIDSFFAAKDNVNRIKAEFKDKVTVFLITKNFINGTEKAKFNIDNIDNYLQIEYTKESLNLKI